MTLKEKLTEALEKIEEEISDYDIKNCNLPKSALINIKLELEKMYEVMDQSKYKPSYPRFLLDYPETEFTNYIIEVAYLYEKRYKS